MLIVEGPDGAGKTTLVRELESQLGWKLADKAVGSDTKALTDMKAWTELQLNKGFREEIFDRFNLLSEPIYGAAMKPTGRAEMYDFDWLETQYAKFWKIEPIIIYCLPPFDVVNVNVQADEHNRVVQNHIDPIYRGYVAQYAALKAADLTAVWKYDYTTTGAAEVLDWIDEELEDDGD